MKIWLISIVNFLFICNIYGQRKTFFTIPNYTDKFINNENISWSADNYSDPYSFLNSKKVDDKNIYDYILAKQSKGLIKSYLYFGSHIDSSNVIFSKNRDCGEIINYNKNENYYSDYHIDSLKNFNFYQIFYLENYRLKSHLASASAQYNIVISPGINIGLSGKSTCCLNDNYKASKSANDRIIFLKEFQTTINLDSISNFHILKETYQMSLVQSLWFGASKGYSKLIDLRKNDFVPAKDLMDYPLEDSVEIPTYDSLGNPIKAQKVRGGEVIPYLVNSVQSVQGIYFNESKNIFYSVIKECYLFVEFFDFKTNGLTREKRFKVIF